MNHSARSRLELTTRFESIARMKDAKSIQSEFFADLNYPNKEQSSVFPSYACMASLAEQWGCERVLEIGSGSSTAVWATFAQRTGAEVCTIDADCGRLRSYIQNTRHDATVSTHVELIEGTTIGHRDFIDFYNGEPKPTFAGTAVTSCKEHLDLFQSKKCSIKRGYGARTIAGRWNWSASEVLTRGSSLHLPRQLLDMFSTKRNFDNEIAFMAAAESRGESGVINKLIAKGRSWDLIFFDSGELSSMIEWTMLKDRIEIGGFAAFHDILFPKSIKNIIPCAAVMADPDWDVVFLDDSSKQGLLIAKRLR